MALCVFMCVIIRRRPCLSQIYVEFLSRMKPEAEIVYSFVLGFGYPSHHCVHTYRNYIPNFGYVKRVHDFAGQREGLWFITDIDRVLGEQL